MSDKTSNANEVTNTTPASHQRVPHLVEPVDEGDVEEVAVLQCSTLLECCCVTEAAVVPQSQRRLFPVGWNIARCVSLQLPISTTDLQQSQGWFYVVSIYYGFYPVGMSWRVLHSVVY